MYILLHYSCNVLYCGELSSGTTIKGIVLLLCYNRSMNDNKNQNYWFKRRRYGYGWTPVTWQGWLTVILFLVVILSGAVMLLKDTPRNTVSAEVFVFLAFLAIATALAAGISLMKGPKPKWRWGSKPTDSPDEDI